MFPIGCLNGVLGVGLWIIFKLGWIELYPASLHANLMIGGFLFSYALGFLWTAIPRFLQAPMPRDWELALLVSTMAVTPVLGLLADPAYFYCTMLIALVHTALFGRARFRLRKSAPPPSFLFLMAGIALASLSLVVLILSSRMELAPWLVAVSRTFFLKGFLLCLILGVGQKLLPILLGWHPIPSGGGERFRIDPLGPPILLALLAGVMLEALGELRWAGLAYTGALASAGLLRMKLASPPRARSALAYGVWLGGLAVALSPLSIAYDPGFAVHYWHLVFISGMGLMTMFVSLRVLLSHSGQEFLRWEKNPAFYLMGALIILASVTRVTAPMLGPASLLSHYAYAAGAWIAALLIWSFYFARFTPGFGARNQGSGP